MIEVRDLTKFYGPKAAVDHLTFTVEPGLVTGFLGPNGAGKSTTMRLILGLDRPQAGRRAINGRPYRDCGPAAHGRRAAGGQVRAHRPECPQPPAVPGPDAGAPARRVDEMLALVGLRRWRASGPAASRSA